MKIPHQYIGLSTLQKEALTGSMLGDGHLCLQKHSINASLMIGRAIKDKEYLEYEAMIFANLAAPRYTNGVIITKYFDKSIGKIDIECKFATSNNPSLTEYHNKWYNNKIKVIPPDLELSAISIAHWIADDGSIWCNKLPYRFVLELSTHSFTEEENHFLSSLLEKRYNEEFLVRPKNRNGKRYYVIRSYDSACRAVFSDINEHFKMSRKRIWDKEGSRFWNDPPERQVSKVKEFRHKRDLLASIIDNGNELTLIELAHELGYVYKNGTIEYGGINKLLKPYIDLGKIIKEVDVFNNNTTTIRVIK